MRSLARHLLTSIVVWFVFAGIVNNMGALRTQPLEEWGNGRITKQTQGPNDRTEYQVLNWDGTLVPVVHQFDRHKELSEYFFKYRTDKLVKEWKQRLKTEEA